jgi:rubrerythrin
LKRLASAPNLAIATLWAELLTQEGFAAVVQRPFASSIAGEIPPDQAQPEVWLLDDAKFDGARARLAELQRPPAERRWVCRQCGELVEGPFEQCWNCGAMAP